MEPTLSRENGRGELAVGVYLSSTWLDLRPERQAVEEVLHRFQTTKFVGMEYFGSKPEDTTEASLQALDRCRVYVGIFGRRYGSGITEREYRKAREAGLECFIYCQSAETCDPAAGRLRSELKRAHTVTEFRTPEELASKVAADLHNWIFDKWVANRFLRSTVDGIDVLPMDYASRIENFLTEYLGTERRPVPFGGRGAEMEALDAWLECGGQKPYALLAASAGRGKSALVTRWSRTLLGRPDVSLIFLPVSIRFRTNLASVVFASLAARLARVFGEEVRAAGEITVEVWRGLVSSYLRRRPPAGGRLVVVLDGLDEAADWSAEADLFPQQPPDGLKVLTTARYRTGDIDASAWLQALGWDHGLGEAIELDPLTRAGVSEVMLRMGAPLDHLSARVDVVGELHRLSEGDPLLVRLYVEDLWSRGSAADRLCPEDLVQIKPGLSGYFQRWWREQQLLWAGAAPLREMAVQSVLNLLSCALGPLSAEDLLQLAPEECGLNTWTLQEALRPLNRFVIGDGHEQGFVFTHPRLSIYFYGLLTPQERSKWERRFLEWGARCLAEQKCAQQNPTAVPAYLVQYYGAHLERTHAGCDALLALVSDGWRQAWLAFEGAFSGFLNDVERAWRVVEGADTELVDSAPELQYVDRAIECALCLASVRSLAANIQPGLLAALLEKGVWTGAQALAYLRQTPDRHQKMLGLARVAQRLPEGLLEQALALGDGLAPPELLSRMAECGRAARAIELLEADSIWVEQSGVDQLGAWRDDSGYQQARASAVAGIAPWLTPAQAAKVYDLAKEAGDEQSSLVEALADRMDPEVRQGALESTLLAAIEKAREGTIRRVAQRMDAQSVWRVWLSADRPSDEWDERLVRSVIMDFLPPEVRHAVLADLTREMQTIEPAPGRRLEILARALPHVNEETRAAFLRELVQPSTARDLLRRAAAYFDEASIAKLADIALAEIESWKEVLPVIAGKLSPERWEHLIRQLLAETVDPRLLEFVARYLPDAERRRAFDLITKLEDAQDQGCALWALAPVLDRDQIEDAVFQAEYVGAPASTFPRLAKRLAELGNWQAAIERVDRSGWNRDEVLKAVAEAVTDNEEALRAIVKRCAAAADPPGLVTAIAGKLPPKLLREALPVVQRIGDIDALDRAREALAWELVHHGNSADAVRISDRIEGKYRDEILESLATALAEKKEPRLALRLTARIADNGAAGRVLDRCLNIAGESGFEEALDLVRQRMQQPWTIGRHAQFVLLERWPLSHAAELPAFIAAIEDEWKKCHAMTLPSDAVVRKVAPQLLEILSGVESIESRAPALGDLAVKTEGADRTAAVRELLGLARLETGAGAKVRALAQVRAWDVEEFTSFIVSKLGDANERETTELLKIVSEDVPERIWQEVWDAAGRLSSPADRAVVKTKLAACAPQARKADANGGALQDALNVRPERQRKEVLLQIAEHLAEPDRTAAWEEAFQSAALEQPQTDEAMAGVILAMPEDLLLITVPTLVGQRHVRQSILLLAHRLGERKALLEQRLRAAGRLGLLTILEEFGEFDLAKVAAIESHWERAYELASMVDSLHDADDEKEALEIARGIPHPGAKARALDALMDLPNAGAIAKREAVRLAAEGTLAREEVVRLLTRARDPENIEWRQAAAKALREFSSLDDVTNLISIAPLAAVLPAPERFRLLSNLLRCLSRSPRRDLLLLLKPMAEWVRAAGGTDTLNRTAEAIERVAAWWP